MLPPLLDEGLRSSPNQPTMLLERTFIKPVSTNLCAMINLSSLDLLICARDAYTASWNT